jgi:hypothetical protein
MCAPWALGYPLSLREARKVGRGSSGSLRTEDCTIQVFKQNVITLSKVIFVRGRPPHIIRDEEDMSPEESDLVQTDNWPYQ